MTVQLPIAGTMAPLSFTVLDAMLSDSEAPVQLVAGVGELAIVNAVGSVSVILVCVRAKPLALLMMIVNDEAMLIPTALGENVWEIVGATGVADTVSGQAVVPALLGAVLVALFDATVTNAVSVSPVESVTVSVTVPEPLPDSIVACADVAPDTMLALPLAVQAYDAIARPQEAALPLPSNNAPVPTTNVVGSATAAIGR